MREEVQRNEGKFDGWKKILRRETREIEELEIE